MDNKNKINAFSLVELIVWITISMLLMVSIWVFVSSGMNNIFLQEQSLKNSSSLNNYVNILYQNFNHLKEKNELKIIWNNAIIFRAEKNFNDWGFTYIWEQELNKYFCENDESENTLTNHLFIKNFIPLIENWENINSNFWDILESNWVNLNWKTYKTKQKENILVDENWDIIIWNEVFWDNLIEWWSWTLSQLNWPTWITTDWEVLYISDTLNDRILYLSWSNVYKLLDQNDWLEEPTWLFYDNSDKSLLISNSAKWEILKVSSEIKANIPTQNLSFSWASENSISRIYLSYYKNWEKLDLSSSNFWISNISIPSKESSDDKINIINNKIEYNFREPILNYSGAIIWYKSRNENFSSGTEYDINVNFNWVNWFSEVWNYTVALSLWDFEKNYFHFTQWDEKIYTQDDNKIEILYDWLDYPNWIWWQNVWEFNEFDINGVTYMQADKDYDKILKVPLEDFNISENNYLVTAITKYYKNYNCFNIDQNTWKISTFISKFNLE